MHRATNRNERLTSVLKDLTGRVEDEDRARIESALNDVSRIDRRAHARDLLPSMK
jgi:hypothetical protein